jgi:hypothetical protein
MDPTSLFSTAILFLEDALQIRLSPGAKVHGKRQENEDRANHKEISLRPRTAPKVCNAPHQMNAAKSIRTQKQKEPAVNNPLSRATISRLAYSAASGAEHDRASPQLKETKGTGNGTGSGSNLV